METLLIAIWSPVIITTAGYFIYKCFKDMFERLDNKVLIKNTVKGLIKEDRK